MKKRSLLITLVVFAVVTAAGVALAQGGVYAPLFEKAEKVTTTTLEKPSGDEGVDEKPPAQEPAEEKAEEPAEKPAEEPAEQPKDESAEEPKDQPAEEPKDEPAEEPEADVTPPELFITTPEDGARFAEKALKFRGETEPGARVFAGKYEADVNEAGEWAIVLMLAPGKNHVTFVAKDEAGNKSDASVTVYYDAPEGEFTANQKYGSCSDPIPWEKFYGTGTPGSWIEAVSEYGSGETKVKDDGTWYLKVTFPEAPYGKTFPVTVKDAFGHKKVFEFTSYSSGEVEFTINQKYGTNTMPWEKFYGTATPGTHIVAVSDYGSADLKAADDGKYYLKVHFTEPPVDTPFTIVVETSEGYRGEFAFTYHPEPVEFTINQYFGSGSELWEKFYGTANPGTTIVAVSDYGSADLTVGSEGTYYLKVHFTEPPADTPFTIVVETSEGYRGEFTYTYHPVK